METPSRAFSRLLGALETLVEQEALEMAAGDHAAAQRTQLRVGPLVQRLAEIGTGGADGPTRERLAAVLARRKGTQEKISARLTHLRSELNRVGTALRHLASVVPLYSGASNRVPRRRLSAMT